MNLKTAIQHVKSGNWHVKSSRTGDAIQFCTGHFADEKVQYAHPMPTDAHRAAASNRAAYIARRQPYWFLLDAHDREAFVTKRKLHMTSDLLTVHYGETQNGMYPPITPQYSQETETYSGYIRLGLPLPYGTLEMVMESWDKMTGTFRVVHSGPELSGLPIADNLTDFSADGLLALNNLLRTVQGAYSMDKGYLSEAKALALVSKLLKVTDVGRAYDTLRFAQHVYAAGDDPLQAFYDDYRMDIAREMQYADLFFQSLCPDKMAFWQVAKAFYARVVSDGYVAYTLKRNTDDLLWFAMKNHIG